MRYKYGFIGTGNMGSALARAVVKKCPQNEIALANRNSVKAKTLSDVVQCWTVYPFVKVLGLYFFA